MNRPLFRARNLDPSKRIRLFVDQHDDNNNDLSKSSPIGNLLPSSHQTSNTPSHTAQTSSTSLSKLPQRAVPQMPFVSGMEREEEAEYHLQNALDAQERLGSAKMRAVPIPSVYPDDKCQSIYPSTVELPKEFIRLQPLQLESDQPDYDMDQHDQIWFNQIGRNFSSKLTSIEFETIIDQLENASTRTLVSLDEARTLFASSDRQSISDEHIEKVYRYWHERRTTRNQRLKPRLLTERDVKEEKGKYHPYVAFRRRVEKMTTRKNRKNDEQSYLSMLKLRTTFEAVVKLTNLIKQRENTKKALLESSLSVFQTRCELNAADDEITVKQRSTTKISTNSISRTRPDLKQSSSLLKSSSPHQQLLAQLIRLEQQKKTTKPILATSSQSIADLLQSPMNDSFEQQKKRFKTSHRPSTQTDKLTQLLSSPTNNSSSTSVHNFGTSSSIFDRLTAGNVISAASSSPSQTGRRRSKQQRNLLSQDLLSTSDRTSDDVTSLKAQLLEVARKLQQKEDLENQSVMNTDVTSNGLTNPDENRLDDSIMNVDDDESTDPWRFRPKTGCRYVKPIDSDCQEQNRTNRSTFTSFYQIQCSERGHLGRRRVRVGRGGRILFDRTIDTESSPSVASQFTDKPVLWRLSSRPELVESYHLHSHLHVHGHTRSLAHHFQSKSSNRIHYDDSFDNVYRKSSSPSSRSSIELDHPYACSSSHINRALRTLMEPQPPSPSSSPPLPSSSPLTTAEQMMLISTPPTPPPSAHGEPTQQSSNDFTKTYVLSPNPTFFSPHRQSYVIPSTSSNSSSTSPTCALVQFVQLHRILPSNKTHSFVSSTPVTPLDS